MSLNKAFLGPYVIMVLSQSRFEGPRSDLAAERTFDHKEPQQIRSTAMPTVYSQTTESMYLLSIS